MARAIALLLGLVVLAAAIVYVLVPFDGRGPAIECDSAATAWNDSDFEVSGITPEVTAEAEQELLDEYGTLDFCAGPARTRLRNAGIVAAAAIVFSVAAFARLGRRSNNRD